MIEKEILIKNLSSYPLGTAFRLVWNRGNGELTRDYVYLGKNVFDNIPMLLDYENFENNSAVFFDIENPDISIKDVCVIMCNSLESLVNLG